MKKVTSKSIAKYNGDFKANIGEVQLFDLSEGIQERMKRREEHEVLVRELADYLERKGYELYEGQIDCLAIKDGSALIFEVKILNREKNDERSQVLKALAQLKYYKKFTMGKFSEYENIYLFAVFSHKISNEYIEFLEDNDINSIYKSKDKFEQLKNIINL